MHRNSLITAGLVAAGLISAASANAVVVTLTGSTAFRAVVYTACKTPGVVFASAASGAPADPKVVSATDNNGANDIVYEGYIQNADTSYTLYDLDCSFTGSEAGIAAVAGVTTLLNDTPAFNGGTSPMPGVPPAYLTAASTWTTKGAPGALATDLAFADTSQAVSLTKKITGTATDLVPYGVVGIVPFMWMKGKNSAPTTSSWGHLTNITHPAAKLALSGPQVPRLFTGNAADPDTDTVIVVGRNKGSGTHVNQLLDSNYGLTVQVDQFAIRSSYVGNGVLTFSSVGAFTDANVLEVGNDGYDSGGSVANCLKCDGTGSTYIPIGFMGIPDSIGLPIHTGGAEAGGAVILTLDGVTESNAAVENAQYTAWGHENLYGKHGQLTTDAGGKVAAKLVTGIPATLTTLGWGVTAATQDAAIPLSLMHADKSGDIGYPFPQ